MRSDSLGEFLRARLALVTAGHEPLSAPKRAVPDEGIDEPDNLLADDGYDGGDIDDDQPSTRAGGGAGSGSGGDRAMSGGAPGVVARVGAAPRPAFDRRHLVTVVAVGVLVALVTAVLWWRDQPSTMPIPVAHAGGSSASGQAATSSPAAPSPTPPPDIDVHVAGAVAQPGVVRLREGARVGDAITAAGGLRTDADPADLNLAAVLADGSQVLIGTKTAPAGEVRGGGAPPEPASTGQAAPGRKLNLNKATQAEFEALPGIGPVTAKAIIDWRARTGGFTRVEELQEIEGIGPKTYAKLAELVEV